MTGAPVFLTRTYSVLGIEPWKNTRAVLFAVLFLVPCQSRADLFDFFFVRI